MSIYLFTIVRNEERILPYFLRHYSQFCDWMFFWDDASTDATRDIIKSIPNTIVIPWEGTPGIVDDEFNEFAQEAYKKQRGCSTWSIWVDADEFLYHPDMKGLLRRYWEEGVEVPLIEGFNMVGRKFPSNGHQIYDELRTGYKADTYSKPIVFRSDIDMKWWHGKHSLAPGFTPKRSATAEIKLLHYRFIDPDYVRERNLNNWNRMPLKNQQSGYGWTCNPDWHGEHSFDWYMQIKDEDLIKDVLSL